MKSFSPYFLFSHLTAKAIIASFFFVWAALSGAFLAVLPIAISIPLVVFPLLLVLPFYPSIVSLLGLWICSGILLNYTPIGTSVRMSFIGPVFVLIGSLVALIFGPRKSDALESSDTFNGKFLKALVLIFVVYCGFQSFLSVFIRGADSSEVVLEYSPIFVWVFLLLWPTSFNKPDARGRLFLWGTVAVFAAVVVVLQAKLNIPLMAGGRVESLRTLTSTYSDVTRTVTDNIHSIVLLFLLIPAFVMRFRPPTVVVLFVATFCIGAIYFQYGRALWITVFIAIVLFSAVSLNGRQLKLAVFFFFVSVASAAALFSFVDSPVLKAGADRLFSVGAEVSSGSSFDWRRWENETAIKRIAANPLFGIGPGVHYRRVVDPGTFAAQTRYMHNSYLYVAMKYGLIGLISLLAIVSTVFIRVCVVMRSYKRGEWQRLLCGGIISFFIMFFIISFNQPELMAVMSSLTFVFASWLGLSMKINKTDHLAGNVVHV